jgi:hypothetical protein
MISVLKESRFVYYSNRRGTHVHMTMHCLTIGRVIIGGVQIFNLLHYTPTTSTPVRGTVVLVVLDLIIV